MGKVEKDLAAHPQTSPDLSSYCADEAGEKERAIAKSKAAVEDLTAVVTNSKAIIATTESEIQETSDQIAENESELKKAGGLRAAAHQQFLANEKELVDAVSSLSRASTQIKKGMSFAQLPEKTRTRVTT